MTSLDKTIGALMLAGLLSSALSLSARANGDVYDASGRLIETVSEDGVVVRLVYDRHGRLVQERFADGRVVDHEQPEPASDE